MTYLCRPSAPSKFQVVKKESDRCLPAARKELRTMSARNLAQEHAASQGQSQHRHGNPKPQNKAWPVDFRHPDDAKSRKANYRCVLKARIFNVWRFIGSRATARQIAQLLHLPLRTAEWGMALLKHQKFVGNVRKCGLNGPMEVEFRILRPSTGESCGVKAFKKVHTEKPKQDTHDNERLKTAVSFERESNPTARIKPFRTPRQVFEVAKRLVGPEYAAWIYYRALHCGRLAGKSFAQCVPRSTSYYVKGHMNFCRQYGPQQHQGILENSADRVRAEEDLWMDVHEYFSALDRVPRQWKEETKIPSQEVPKKKRAKRTKNPCGQDHNWFSPCAACDATGFGGAA
jgi:hypothetical protein